ncbi:MAG: hypothetical protein ACT4PZ_14775 [Panacagrimonas sp.]
MFTPTRSRPLIWLALFAWLAQLCLPVAHAAAMAKQDAGLATWCGPLSPGMARQLAQLPDEVRDILEKGTAQADHQQDCVQLCANASGTGLPAPSVTVALRAAGLEAAPAAPMLRAHQSFASSPQPRGPPLKS